MKARSAAGFLIAVAAIFSSTGGALRVLGFDRLGLAFKSGTTGEPPGIKFVFRSVSEL